VYSYLRENMEPSRNQFLGFFKHSALMTYWQYFLIIFLFFPVAIIYGHYIYAPSDDMYIFLVYARNFIDGNGLTFNGTVVEGFTSVFWVFLLSSIGLTRIPLPQLAESLSILSSLFALFTTYKLARSMGIQPEWLALTPSALLALTGDFAFYSVVGLEEVLFTALVALSMALIYSQPADRLLRSGYYPLLLAILILTRPEGALICALLFLIVLRKDNFTLVIRCGVTLVLFLLPILLWKRSFYGFWLPNTWYVKGGAGLANLEHGIVYFLFNAQRYLGVLVLMASIAIYGHYKNKSLPFIKNILPLMLIVVIWLVYIIIQGGDNMVGGRFLLPILPAVYCIVVKFALDVRMKHTEIILGAMALGISLFYGYVANPGLDRQAQSWRDAFSIRKSAGMYLYDHFSKETVVALNQAGIIPYYSQLPTIDMLGLNDVQIAHHGKRDYGLWYAHQAGDGEYVLSRNPDIIIFSGLTLSAGPGEFISDQEIWASDQFKNEYELVEWPGIGFVYSRKGDQ